MVPTFHSSSGGSIGIEGWTAARRHWPCAQSSWVAPCGKLTKIERKSSLPIGAYWPQKQHMALEPSAIWSLKPANVTLSLRAGRNAELGGPALTHQAVAVPWGQGDA